MDGFGCSSMAFLPLLRLFVCVLVYHYQWILLMEEIDKIQSEVVVACMGWAEFFID